MKRCNTGSAWLVVLVVISIHIFVTSSIQAAGNVYYAATYGNDNNSCNAARDINTPKRNLMGTEGGIACMQTPGDKLLIREGTYAESLNNYTAPYSWPSGTDWTNNVFTVAAYPGETVVIQGIAIATDDNLRLSYWI